MGKTELPWLLYGRHVRPYALAVSLTMAVLGWYILVVGYDPGSAFRGRTLAALFAGISSWLSCVLLWLGFWLQSGTAMKFGLLISSGVMAARAFLFWILDDGFGSQSAWFSLCWAVASGGAYLLELTTADNVNGVRTYRNNLLDKGEVKRGYRE